MLKKRGFLIVLLAMMFCTSYSSHAETERTIVWQNVFPPKHRISAVVENFSNAVIAETNGNLKIEFHYGEPVPTKELLGAGGVGLVDAFNSGMLFYSGKVGILDFMMMPFNFDSYEDLYDAFVSTEIWEIVDSVYRKSTNVTVIYPFCLFADEGLQLSKKAKKVRHIEDLKGLKIRVAGGVLSEAVKLLDMSPVQTITGELYTALQRGTVDGGLIPNYVLRQYKTWEVCDQILYPKFFTVGSTPAWMNVDTWNSLSKEHQDAIKRVARNRELFMKNSAYIAKLDEEVDKIAKEKYNIEYYHFPAKDAQKIREMLEPVWDKYIENCEKQGFGQEAEKIVRILNERYRNKIQ